MRKVCRDLGFDSDLCLELKPSSGIPLQVLRHTASHRASRSILLDVMGGGWDNGFSKGTLHSGAGCWKVQTAPVQARCLAIYYLHIPITSPMPALCPGYAWLLEALRFPFRETLQPRHNTRGVDIPIIIQYILL